MSEVTEKLAQCSDYFSSSLELKQITSKCAVGDVSIQRTALHRNMNDKSTSHGEAQKKIAFFVRRLFVNDAKYPS